MDPLKLAVMGIAGVTTITIVKTIAGAIIRYAEVHRREAGVDEQTIRDRLERIELAVDTIAIEIERLGEHQRFNAQLAMNRPAPLPPKTVTPH
jgi:hypothetical protein